MHPKWFPLPSALFAEVMLPCDLLSCFKNQPGFFFSPNLPNLENIGFFSFKSVFLLHGFCHRADYVMPKVTAQGLSQELDKLEHV